jgi:hypothetical protein
MRNFKWMAACAWVAMVGGVAGFEGCTSEHERVTYPDGTVFERSQYDFHPNLAPMLPNYQVQDRGQTLEGLRIKEWLPRRGGETLYEVDGKFFTKKTIFQQPTLNEVESKDEVDSARTMGGANDEYRLSADLLNDNAELIRRVSGTDSWRVVARGDVQTVAAAAMRRGLGAMDFDNEFGSWSIRVDSPIPVVVTRLNGEIVDVRGVPMSGKPNLDTSTVERWR